MTQMEALALIEQMLHAVVTRRGGRVDGKGNYRTVTFDSGAILGVDVLVKGKAYGHIRVHLFGNIDDRHISGEAQPASALQDECPKCTRAPRAYPVCYQGEKGRRYYGYQWHTATSPDPQDIDRIREAVERLIEHVRH